MNRYNAEELAILRHKLRSLDHLTAEQASEALSMNAAWIYRERAKRTRKETGVSDLIDEHFPGWTEEDIVAAIKAYTAKRSDK